MDRRSLLIMGVSAGALGALESTAWAAAPSDADRAVRPEDFGGPQAKNSLVKAMAKAGELGLPLKCQPVDYLIDAPLIPAKGLRWHANGCRVVASTDKSSPAVRIVNDDVRVHGLLRISLSDPGGQPSANRGHVLVGDWMNGAVAPSGFQFDDLELDGGHMNCNGFAVAGGANQIRGNRIHCGDNDRIGRLFLAHWGNFAQHNKPGAQYLHVNGYGPTAHPHAISVREVSSGRLSCPTPDFMAVAAISAGYDIDLGKVSGVIDKPTPAADLVLLTAGDLGFAYATPAERSRGMGGIRIGTVEGRSSGNGVNRIGMALYRDKDSTPQPADFYFAKIEDTVTRVSVTVTGKSAAVLAGSNGHGRSRYGTIEAEGGRVCVGIPNFNTDTVIETLRCKRSLTRGVEIAGAGGDPSAFPRGIQINAVEIDGTDLSGTGAPPNKSGMLIQSAEQVRVGHVKVASLAPGGYAGVLGTKIKDVQVGDSELPGNYDPKLGGAWQNVERRPDVSVGRSLGVNVTNAPNAPNANPKKNPNEGYLQGLHER